MGERIFEAHVTVSNLEASMEFYEKFLGLELGMKEENRRIAFYFVGGWNNSMLGLWEKPREQISWQHFAIEVGLPDLERKIALLHEQGIETKDFAGNISAAPFVFAWMPAAAIYFDDPDGHTLEYICPLPGPPRPELGVLGLEAWRASQP